MTDTNLTAPADASADVTQNSEVAGVPVATDVATQTGENGTALTTEKSDESTNAGEGDATTDNVYTDFVLPEGMTLDAAVLDQAIPIFKELGLTKEQSQKLIDIHASQIQNSIKSQAESFDQLKQDWRSQTEKDNEIGGDKLPETVATARIALEKLGTPELTKLLDDFGIGNNPEMIRFMARVGSFMREDSPGKTGTPTVGTKKDRASVLYPNS